MNNEEKILAMLAQMQTDITDMKGDITSIKARLDYDVDKRFDAVNEGIDSILEKLTPKSRVDEMEADIIVLKTAVKAMAQRIAELEKAQ